MSKAPDDIRSAQFTFVSSYVRSLDPTATEAAIARYLAEIETMAKALQSLDIPLTSHFEPFSPEWPDGDLA